MYFVNLHWEATSFCVIKFPAGNTKAYMDKPFTFLLHIKDKKHEMSMTYDHVLLIFIHTYNLARG